VRWIRRCGAQARDRRVLGASKPLVPAPITDHMRSRNSQWCVAAIAGILSCCWAPASIAREGRHRPFSDSTARLWGIGDVVGAASSRIRAPPLRSLRAAARWGRVQSSLAKRSGWGGGCHFASPAGTTLAATFEPPAGAPAGNREPGPQTAQRQGQGAPAEAAANTWVCRDFRPASEPESSTRAARAVSHSRCRGCGILQMIERQARSRLALQRPDRARGGLSNHPVGMGRGGAGGQQRTFGHGAKGPASAPGRMPLRRPEGPAPLWVCQAKV